MIFEREEKHRESESERACKRYIERASGRERERSKRDGSPLKKWIDTSNTAMEEGGHNRHREILLGGAINIVCELCQETELLGFILLLG